MITPSKIQEIADPVEGIYINCVNELMVNIGKHITSPTWTHTASWEIQKLSEMGQLTKENAAIINKWIKQIPPAMRSTMEATRAAALDRLEKQMEQAEKDGYIQPPLADSTVQIFKDYADQAVDKMNMVNTTMLQSTLSQYQKAVNLTAEIMQQAEATQNALNAAAGSVSTGVETRTKAIQRAIKTIADEGLTGFYDRAGRSWSPEAYVNMVIRTTVHNTAIQATESRMKDYGTDVFQISSHAGARPLCYPYQGWFCSWSNTSGEIELGDGSIVQYKPLNETSYGQPAGIFGINCGHYPIPIIAGYTIPHGADNIQPEEENDKAYALSQEQRALERQIRAAKRVVEMGDTSDEAKQAVKDAQAKMRKFIADTGRTRRYDREQLYGNASKATPAASQNVNSQLTSQPPNLDIFKNTTGVSDNFKQGMAATLNNSQHPEAQALYAKYADQLVCVNDHYKRGAHFSNRDQGVSMDAAEAAQGRSIDEPYEIAFHEFGHMIDWLAGGKTYVYLSNGGYNGNSLLDTIKSDFQVFKKSLGVSKAKDVIPILKAENLSDKEKGNISDILEKCTGVSYPLGVGHGTKYHQRDGATEREFFAEVLDSAASNEASYKQMQRLFPNAVDMVWDMVKMVT